MVQDSKLVSVNLYLSMGLSAGLLSYLSLQFFGHPFEISMVAAVAILCIIWWIFEPIPIPVTSLIPLAIFPLAGVSNTTTVFCKEGEKFSIYKSDRHGFNNPDSEWDKKEIEYLLVGDSFTYGECVNRPNDIASVLRALSNKSVLNLGQSDNGPLIEYATLREYLDKNVKKLNKQKIKVFL